MQNYVLISNNYQVFFSVIFLFPTVGIQGGSCDSAASSSNQNLNRYPPARLKFLEGEGCVCAWAS